MWNKLWAIETSRDLSLPTVTCSKNDLQWFHENSFIRYSVIVLKDEREQYTKHTVVIFKSSLSTEFKISVTLLVAWYITMISDFWDARDFFCDEPLHIVISFRYIYDTSTDHFHVSFSVSLSKCHGVFRGSRLWLDNNIRMLGCTGPVSSHQIMYMYFLK